MKKIILLMLAFVLTAIWGEGYAQNSDASSTVSSTNVAKRPMRGQLVVKTPQRNTAPTTPRKTDGWDDGPIYPGDEPYGEGPTGYESMLPDGSMSVEEWIFRDNYTDTEYQKYVTESRNSERNQELNELQEMSSKEIYDNLRDCINFVKIYTTPDLYYLQMCGFELNSGVTPLISPIFTGNPYFTSSKNAAKIIAALKERYDIEQIEADLESYYKSGTLNVTNAMKIYDSIWFFGDWMQRVDCAMGTYVSQYEKEYAKAHWKCYANSYFGTDYAHNGYANDFHKKNLYDGAFKQGFSLFSRQNVSSYCMVLSKKGKDYNPKSWTLYGFDATYIAIDQYGDGSPECGMVPDYESTYNSEYFNNKNLSASDYAPDPTVRWNILSSVKNVDLASMDDGSGVVTFNIDNPLTCTHLLLVVTDAQGGKEMYFTNFYLGKAENNRFTAEKTNIKIDEESGKIIFKTALNSSASDWKLVTGKLTLRHADHEMKGIEDIENSISVNSKGEFVYDMSQWYKSQLNYDKFPFKVGRWCDAILSYTVKNKTDNTTKTIEQTFPIKVECGKPTVWMGPNDAGDYMVDNLKEDATVQYPITIDCLDPARGFSFDIFIDDFVSGKLAKKHYSYSAEPGYIEMYEDSSCDLPWLHFERSDYGYTEQEKITHAQTLRAYITVPVVTIPMCDDAKVSARALNDYSIITSKDITVNPEDYYEWMGATVYNNAFNPDLLKGTYVVGSSNKSKPIDIKKWVNSDKDYVAKVRNDIKANINNPQAIEKIIEDVRGHNIITFNFEYPSAWGEVNVYMTTESNQSKGRRAISIKDQYGERIVSESTFSRIVEFPHDGQKHTLVLSWQDGRFEQTFEYTSDAGVLDGLFCYVPIVNDDPDDKVHDITISYGKVVNGGIVNGHSFERSGHFSANTKYRDNKVYILDEGLDCEDANRNLYRFNCTLKSNNFVSTYNNRWHAARYITVRVVKPITLSTQKWGIHRSNESDAPYSEVTSYPISFDLRSEGKYVRFSVVNEKGEALNNSTIRYIYAQQAAGDSILFAGVDANYTPFSKEKNARGEVPNTTGENIYLVPLITSEDSKYHLFVEVSNTDKNEDGNTYATRVFSEILDGDDFRECVETGNVYPCVLGPNKKGEGDYYVHDLWVRGATTSVLSSDADRYNPCLSSVMNYTGNDKYRIDLLMSRSTNAPAVDTYMLAPISEGASYYIPYEMSAKKLTTATDAKARPIKWNTSETGFTRNYEMFTVKDLTMLTPGKTSEQDAPDPGRLVVWKGKTVGGKSSILYNTTKSGAKLDGQACAPAITALNYEKDNSEEMAQAAVDALDMKMPKLSFDQDMGFPKPIGSAFASLPLNGPDCFPFKILTSFYDDHYTLRGSFEYNALDNFPGYALYSSADKVAKGVEKMSKVAEEFNRVKNELDPEKVTMDDVYDIKMPEAFVGFKGYFDASLYYDKQDSIWRPYFNALVARQEASFGVKIILPFAGVGSINFALNAEAYAQFMLSNPAANDKYLKGRNHLSHFNIYGMLGANIDVDASMQAGFDFGIVAACVGIRGAASASIDACVSSRPWLPKGSDGKFNVGMRLSAKASMSAFAKARFLFWEKRWEYKFFDTGRKTLYVPNTDLNPYKNDPNLFFEDEKKVKTYIRRAGEQFHVRHAAPRYRAKEVLSGIDAFSTPTYLGHEGQIAYFNLNNASTPIDDRLQLRNGSNVKTVDEQSNRPVAAFSAATASGKDVSILAMQCMNADAVSSFDVNDDSESSQLDVANNTEIVALVNNGSTLGKAQVISEAGKAHLAPKAGIDADGNAAIAWPSGEMEFVTTADGSSNGIIKGDFNLSTFDGSKWSDPVSLTKLSKNIQISDYAVAVSGGMPIVMATIPTADGTGNISNTVYAITHQAGKNGGSTMFQSLGFQGSAHQVVSLQDGRFIAATRTDADSIGADILLYEGKVKDGVLDIKKLGRLGLERNDITIFKIVTPKGGTNKIDELALVWAQHDIEVTDAQENEARGYNTCYAARISTTNGLKLSHPVLICELTDDDNVANMDAYSNGSNKLTSLICITGAGADASTGAYVLQTDVTLSNQLQSAGSRINGNIKKGQDAQIEFKVQNTGIDPITSLTAKVGEVTATATTNIKPGELGVINVALPGGTDFSKDIPYSVDAVFTDAKGSTSENGFTSAFHFDIAEISAKLLSNTVNSKTNTVDVLASITDRTISALNSGYTVKVGLYTDPNGMNLYPGTTVQEIKPSQFRVSGSNIRKPYMAGFSIRTYKDVDAHAYLIVNTVTPSGDIVWDQDNSDNTVAIALDPTAKGNATNEGVYTIVDLVRLIAALNSGSTSSEMDYDGNKVVNKDDIRALANKISSTLPSRLSVLDLENPSLKVRNLGGSIEVEGINPDKDLKLYTGDGQLIKWVDAPSKSGDSKTTENAKTATIPVKEKGQIIIINDNQAGIIKH